MDAKDIADLVQRGLTENMADGRAAVIVAVQLPLPPDQHSDMASLRTALEAQVPALSTSIAPLGAEVVPGSLVPLGQMVQVRVPLDKLTEFQSLLTSQGLRSELPIPRRMNDP